MAKRRKRTDSNVPVKSRLSKFADDLWALAVKADWNHRCAVCGRGGTLNAHHLINRGHQATRFNLRNGIALCVHHHKFDINCSPHGCGPDPAWELWLEEHYPGLSEWVFATLESGDHRRFDGTTNAAYYCDVILGLQEYVEEEDYVRIVGKKFAAYLAAEDQGDQ